MRAGGTYYNRTISTSGYREYLSTTASKYSPDDNGPPFNGEEYQRYLTDLCINKNHSTPKWPQGNAEVERFNQPLGKASKAATIEGKVWQQELNRFLLQYRTTPHSSTKVPPAELL